jgi:catechol 2,3-dioxygenase-like lactoylglutathione lyase family enzyme
MKMNMACHHIGIFTRDPERLIQYYTQGLGFDEGETRILSPELMEQIFGIKDECQLTKLTQDHAVIEIFAPLHSDLIESSKRTAGYNHWALEVEDKEAYVQTLEERAVPVIRVDHQGRVIYFISDPEGNLIEIYEPKRK